MRTHGSFIQIWHVLLLIAGLLFFSMTCNQLENALAEFGHQPTDQAITEAVRSNIARATGMPNVRLLSIETTDSIVTLSGTVDNLLIKERATRIAKSTRGVRAVLNNMTIQATRDDADIRNDVELALRYEPALTTDNIVARVNEGRVTLGGIVDSWQELEIAEMVAKSVRGVTQVENDLAIALNLDRPETEILADVRSTLDWNDLVDAELITVRVENNIVTLAGSVGSAQEKELAQKLAYVSGVQFVDASRLKVQPWRRAEMIRTEYEEVADKDIQTAIKDAFTLHPRVEQFEVDVEVVDGHVILSGTVTTVKAKRVAAETARNTYGVVSVTDHITVGTRRSMSNRVLQTRLQEAIIRDPYLDTTRVQFQVENGSIEITGAVGSYFEKWHAGNIAAKMEGVTDIENNIQVAYEKNNYAITRYDWNPIQSDYDYSEAPADFTDVKIRNKTYYEMSWSPWLDHRTIDVTVHDGVVTLDGEVDTWYQKHKAAESAYEAGADSVVNNIQVNLIPKLSMPQKSADRTNTH